MWLEGVGSMGRCGALWVSVGGGDDDCGMEGKAWQRRGLLRGAAVWGLLRGRY